MRLSSKVAIVTGSTRGIGARIASDLAREGARVIVSGRNRDRGMQVVDAIQKDGGDGIFVKADVTKEREVQDLVDITISRYSRLDILVNNAAGTDLLNATAKGLIDTTTEDFDSHVKIALYGTFWCSKYAIPHMLREAAGSIINISSFVSLVGTGGTPGYSSAKGGVNALTRQIACEYGSSGIRANTIIIGIIPNDMNRDMLATPAMEATVRGLHLSPRLGIPEDVSSVAVFLASDDSTFMNACEVRVDGGLLMRPPMTSEVIAAALATASASGNTSKNADTDTS